MFDIFIGDIPVSRLKKDQEKQIAQLKRLPGFIFAYKWAETVRDFNKPWWSTRRYYIKVGFDPALTDRDTKQRYNLCKKIGDF